MGMLHFRAARGRLPLQYVHVGRRWKAGGVLRARPGSVPSADASVQTDAFHTVWAFAWPEPSISACDCPGSFPTGQMSLLGALRESGDRFGAHPLPGHAQPLHRTAWAGAGE